MGYLEVSGFYKKYLVGARRCCFRSRTLSTNAPDGPGRATRVEITGTQRPRWRHSGSGWHGRGPQSRIAKPRPPAGETVGPGGAAQWTWLGPCAEPTKRGMGPNWTNKSPTGTGTLARRLRGRLVQLVNAAAGMRPPKATEEPDERRAAAVRSLLSFDERGESAKCGMGPYGDSETLNRQREEAPRRRTLEERHTETGPANPEEDLTRLLLGPGCQERGWARL